MKSTETNKSTALVNAIAFFIVWLAILYAGADHPPPRGFVVMVLFDLIAAVLVHLRAPAYLNWIRTHQAGRLVRVVRDGLIAGLAFTLLAVVSSFLLGSQTLRVGRSAVDLVPWFAVLGIVGAVNTVVIYSANALVSWIRTAR